MAWELGLEPPDYDSRLVSVWYLLSMDPAPNVMNYVILLLSQSLIASRGLLRSC